MQVPGAGAERKPFLFIYVSFQMFDNATDLRLVTLKIKRADNATLTFDGMGRGGLRRFPGIICKLILRVQNSD